MLSLPLSSLTVNTFAYGVHEVFVWINALRCAFAGALRRSISSAPVLCRCGSLPASGVVGLACSRASDGVGSVAQSGALQNIRREIWKALSQSPQTPPGVFGAFFQNLARCCIEGGSVFRHAFRVAALVRNPVWGGSFM